MMESVQGWRGQPILGVRSRRSAEFWARDWRDMVLDATGAIERKARVPAARGSAWFNDDDLELLREVDGHCSYVQSLRSEDTLTWAAFGRSVEDVVIDGLLDFAFGRQARPTTFTRELWIRYPHPETGRRGHGPEPDVTLHGEGWAYVVEAKWGADLDHEQGVSGAVSQIAMRSHVAESLCDDPARRGVLVIVPSPTRYPWARTGVFARYFAAWGTGYEPLPTAVALGARAVTWEQLLELIERYQPDSEVAAYLRWRLWYAPASVSRTRPTQPWGAASRGAGTDEREP